MSSPQKRFVHQWNKDKTIESLCTVCHETVCRAASLLLVRECELKHRCPGPPDSGQSSVSGVDVSDGRSIQNPKASGQLMITPISELLCAMEWIDPSLTSLCPICSAQPHSQCEMRDGSVRFESHLERWPALNQKGTRDRLLARVLDTILAKLPEA